MGILLRCPSKSSYTYGKNLSLYLSLTLSAPPPPPPPPPHTHPFLGSRWEALQKFTCLFTRRCVASGIVQKVPVDKMSCYTVLIALQLPCIVDKAGAQTAIRRGGVE